MNDSFGKLKIMLCVITDKRRKLVTIQTVGTTRADCEHEKAKFKADNAYLASAVEFVFVPDAEYI